MCYAISREVILCNKSRYFDILFWESMEELFGTVCYFLPYADVVKVSEEELFAVTKEKNKQEAGKNCYEATLRTCFFVW